MRSLDDGGLRSNTAITPPITDLDYSFISPQTGKIGAWTSTPGCTTVDPYADKLNLDMLRKYQSQGVKVLMTIGGWTLSQHLSTFANDPALLASLVKSCVDYMNGVGQAKDGLDGFRFNGIDIDWEFPVTGGDGGNARNPADGRNFVKMIDDFRTAMGSGSVLTVAAPPTPCMIGFTNCPNIAADPNTSSLAFTDQPAPTSHAPIVDWSALTTGADPKLNFVNVMAYDYNGSGWSNLTNEDAPLFSNPSDPSAANGFNVNETVQLYLKAGIPARRLVLGVPYYGYYYGQVNNNNPACATNANCSLFQSFLGRTMPSGPYSGQSTIPFSGIMGLKSNDGVMAEDPVFAKVTNVVQPVGTADNACYGGWTCNLDPDTDVSNIYAGYSSGYDNPVGSGNNTGVYWSYDNSQAMQYKSGYAACDGLGGVMIFDMTFDPSGSLWNGLEWPMMPPQLQGKCSSALWPK